MVVLKNGINYYTLDEASKISDITIKENAKKFAEKVILKQKESTILNEKNYV